MVNLESESKGQNKIIL